MKTALHRLRPQKVNQTPTPPLSPETPPPPPLPLQDDLQNIQPETDFNVPEGLQHLRRLDTGTNEAETAATDNQKLATDKKGTTASNIGARDIVLKRILRPKITTKRKADLIDDIFQPLTDNELDIEEDKI